MFQVPCKEEKQMTHGHNEDTANWYARIDGMSSKRDTWHFRVDG